MDPKVLDAFACRGMEVASFLKSNPFEESKDSKDPLFGSNLHEQRSGVEQNMPIVPLAPGYNVQPPPIVNADSNHLPSSVAVPFSSEKDMLLRQSFSRASFTRRASRNPSILSFGNGYRQASMTSETTFGRAMSGLSALSIDWENLDDFDLEVDHSAHIVNNQVRPNGPEVPQDNSKQAVGV
jgi:hypothetical protein